MRIYQRGDNSPGKWTIAGLLLIAAMMVTPVAVNAISLPYNLVGTTVQVGDHNTRSAADNGRFGDLHGMGGKGGFEGNGGNGSFGGKGELNHGTITHPFDGGPEDPITTPVTSVPEPGTIVLLVGGLGAMLWRQRQRLL